VLCTACATSIKADDQEVEKPV